MKYRIPLFVIPLQLFGFLKQLRKKNIRFELEETRPPEPDLQLLTWTRFLLSRTLRTPPPPRLRFPPALQLLTGSPLPPRSLGGPHTSGTPPSCGRPSCAAASGLPPGSLLFQLLKRLWRVRTAREHRTYMTRPTGPPQWNSSDWSSFLVDV